ncbi:MAG: DUF2390 domain-containing protein [Hyphomonadaceae bacterium]|nr:DUF2390 domain-containing protein [Hyphomonadaceae bacterium]
MLLFAAWFGAECGAALDSAAIVRLRDTVRAWNEAVVRPLRAARIAIRALPESAEPAVQSLRSAIARDELEAERIEQAMLYANWRELAPVLTPPAPFTGPWSRTMSPV